MTYAEILAKKQKRNEALYKDREGGMTFEALANKYDITTPRAHAIYKRIKSDLKNGTNSNS